MLGGDGPLTVRVETGVELMAKRRLTRTVRAFATAGVASLALSTATAQNATLPSQPIRYEIRAATLAEALEAFALQTNVELLTSVPLRTRPAPAIIGSFAPAEALRRLLAGTGLRWQVSNRRTLVITDPDAPPRMSRVADAGGPPTAPRQDSQERPVREFPAGPGVVAGRVTDVDTGAALPGARVTVVGSSRSTATDEQGYYRLTSLPVGPIEIEIEYLGGETRVVAVTVPADGVGAGDFTLASTSDTVVVRGFRSSLARALNQQRTAPNASTIVSADLLGEFPAVNVAEALRRLPGVNFTRSDETGAGQGVLVRGFSPEAINIQLDGIDLQGTGYSRAIDLTGFLTGNIAQVSIQKSLLPSMEAKGSGGLVQIETRTGLDYNKTTFSLGIEGLRTGDRRFGGEFQANGTFATRLAPNLGIVATLQYRERDRTSHSVNQLMTAPYTFPVGTTNAITAPTVDFQADEALSGRLLHGANYGTRRFREDNLTASFNIAWDVANHTKLRLNAQHIRRNSTDHLTTSIGTFNLTPTSAAGLIPMPIPELDGAVRLRRVYASFFSSLNAVSSDKSLEQTAIGLRGETNLGNWQFRYRGGYTKSLATSDNLQMGLAAITDTNFAAYIDPASIVRLPDANGALRIVDGGASIIGDNFAALNLSPAGIATWFNPARYEVQTASLSEARDPTEAYSGEASARHTFGSSVIDYIEIGGKYDRSIRQRLNVTAETSISGLQAAESYVRRIGLGAYLPELGVSSLGRRTFSEIGLPYYGVPSLSIDMARDIYAQLPALAAAGRYNFTDRRGLDPIQDSAAAIPTRTLEERAAGYFETKLTFGRLEIVGGARYEQTYRSGGAVSLATITLPDGTPVPREILIQSGLIDFIDTEGTEKTWTPSFLITWRPDRQVAARLGYFRSTVHPQVRQLVSRPTYLINLNPNAVPAAQRATIREGNPNLRPTVTDNFDLDVAYYFRDTPGLVRIAVFYKRVTDNFTNLLIADRPAEDIRDQFVEYLQPLDEFYPGISNLPPPGAFQYFVNRPVNGEGGTIWGIEGEVIRQLDFLPGFLGHFGVLLNATYTNAKFPTALTAYNASSVAFTLIRDLPLADQSTWSGTASLNYERGNFAARLLYTYQSSSVSSYAANGLNTLVPSYGTLDLRASYGFDGLEGKFSVYLQGDDLLNGTSYGDVRTALGTQGSSSDAIFFPSSVQYRGGRTITLGLRAEF